VTLLSYSVIQVLNANVFSFTQKRKATLNDSAVLDAANDDDNDDDVPEWDSNEVIKLEGHDNEVFVCSWHPSADLIATGSGDATARLWHVPRNVSTQQAASTAISSVKVLRHVSAGNANKSRDVTTLDWNRNGLLATASYDGVARIWKSDGELVKELVGHKGPIFALKWNKSGTHLLSGSFDKSAVIWDAATGALRQQFAFHTAPTLDVDWRSDTSFASCSTDKHILVCELGRNTPLNDFVGHSDEVNAITWDATGRLLASCSDDRTAKLWNCDSPNAVATLSEHAKEIYTIEWAPTGAGTANPSARPLLASASSLTPPSSCGIPRRSSVCARSPSTPTRSTRCRLALTASTWRRVRSTSASTFGACATARCCGATAAAAASLRCVGTLPAIAWVHASPTRASSSSTHASFEVDNKTKKKKKKKKNETKSCAKNIFENQKSITLLFIHSLATPSPSSPRLPATTQRTRATPAWQTRPVDRHWNTATIRAYPTIHYSFVAEGLHKLGWLWRLEQHSSLPIYTIDF
jgi:hypothetical protein